MHKEYISQVYEKIVGGGEKVYITIFKIIKYEQNPSNDFNSGFLVRFHYTSNGDIRSNQSIQTVSKTFTSNRHLMTPCHNKL